MTNISLSTPATSINYQKLTQTLTQGLRDNVVTPSGLEKALVSELTQSPNKADSTQLLIDSQQYDFDLTKFIKRQQDYNHVRAQQQAQISTQEIHEEIINLEKQQQKIQDEKQTMEQRLAELHNQAQDNQKRIAEKRMQEQQAQHQQSNNMNSYSSDN